MDFSRFYYNVNITKEAVLSYYEIYKEEYKKENLTPDSDKIFKENGFKKEGDKYVFEKDGHKQEVDKKVFDIATKQVQEQFKKYEKDLQNYNTLMNTQPEKVPLIFGREKVIEENQQLVGKQMLAQKPVFNVDNSTLDVRTYQINSKSIKDKLEEIKNENFKSAVEKGREEKSYKSFKYN